MKKIGKLKLDLISKRQLEDAEINLLRGGHRCGCGCNESASTYDNQNYNTANSYSGSSGGAKVCWEYVHWDDDYPNIHLPNPEQFDNFG